MKYEIIYNTIDMEINSVLDANPVLRDLPAFAKCYQSKVSGGSKNNGFYFWLSDTHYYSGKGDKNRATGHVGDDVANHFHNNPSICIFIELNEPTAFATEAVSIALSELDLQCVNKVGGHKSVTAVQFYKDFKASGDFNLFSDAQNIEDLPLHIQAIFEMYQEFGSVTPKAIEVVRDFIEMHAVFSGEESKTPEHVAVEMVSGLSLGSCILFPCCGVGTLIAAYKDRLSKSKVWGDRVEKALDTVYINDNNELFAMYAGMSNGIHSENIFIESFN
jgi:hypothetical protein